MPNCHIAGIATGCVLFSFSLFYITKPMTRLKTVIGSGKLLVNKLVFTVTVREG